MRAVLNTTNARIYSLQKHSGAPSRPSLFKKLRLSTDTTTQHARAAHTINTDAKIPAACY